MRIESKISVKSPLISKSSQNHHLQQQKTKTPIEKRHRKLKAEKIAISFDQI